MCRRKLLARLKAVLAFEIYGKTRVLLIHLRLARILFTVSLHIDIVESAFSPIGGYTIISTMLCNVGIDQEASEQAAASKQSLSLLTLTQEKFVLEAELLSVSMGI